MPAGHPFASEAVTPVRHALPSGVRLAMVLGALGLLLALGLAACMTPDRRQLGTHEQLGLPPCSFHQVVGRPCPSCGMTTAWSCVMHGRLADAATANAGGMLLALAAVVAVPWLLASAAAQRWLGWRPSWLWLCVGMVVLAAIMAAQWAWRCFAV